MTQLAVFIACSLDGFIADSQGGLDWLESSPLPGEDYGFGEFLAGVDAVALGRGTYDSIEQVDPLPYGKPVYVHTSRPASEREGVTFWDCTPRDAVTAWEAAGYERVYVDGGRLITSFLDADLIDDLTITIAPWLLGGGSRLFHEMSRQRHLKLENGKNWPSGMLQVRYSRPHVHDDDTAHQHLEHDES